MATCIIGHISHQGQCRLLCTRDLLRREHLKKRVCNMPEGHAAHAMRERYRSCSFTWVNLEFQFQSFFRRSHDQSVEDSSLWSLQRAVWRAGETQTSSRALARAHKLRGQFDLERSFLSRPAPRTLNHHPCFSSVRSPLRGRKTTAFTLSEAAKTGGSSRRPLSLPSTILNVCENRAQYRTS